MTFSSNLLLREYYLEKLTPCLKPWRDFVAVLDAQAEALDVGARERAAMTLRGLARVLFPLAGMKN